MGLFSGKKTSAPPVRNDQVRTLLKLAMVEADAADRAFAAAADDGDMRRFKKAKARFEDALQQSTPAESRAALGAARRHGY
jgi:hypothetical protein